jgi:hypothetical protein
VPELLPPDVRRDEALDTGYCATDWGQPVAWADYVEAMEDWTVRLMVKDGVAIGAVYTQGPEFHVSVVPEWRCRWATRGLLKQIIPFPVAVTRVSPGHEHIAGVLERLGFYRRADGYFVRDAHGH